MDTGEKKIKPPHIVREIEILDYWRKNNIAKEVEAMSLRESPSFILSLFYPKKDFIFYDGPPFGNGLPHLGHILTSTMKDTLLRYKTMQGYKVKREWGWDCHGLPIEVEVEKKLGIQRKEEIENTIGIKKFNEIAKESVFTYRKEWQTVIERLGRWADMEHDYRTMDVSYMESVWSLFKELYEKGLVKKAFKVLPFCPRCETSLSNNEIAGEYSDVEDLSATVGFMTKEKGYILLAWTTTPWTLPGNMALAVGRDIEYAVVLKKGVRYVLAEEKRESVIPDGVVEKTVKGEELIGMEYTPLFPFYKKINSSYVWKVYGGEFVSKEEGTGIVHIAPAFGEDDSLLAKKHTLPTFVTVGKDGRFLPVIEPFDGLSVKPVKKKTETDEKIVEYLKKEGRIFSSVPHLHSYPHCWRCGTPLIQYAVDSWNVAMPTLKNELLRENKKTKWVPSSLRDGRFGRWLSEVREWPVSRLRYWGTPLPVWENKKTGKTIVIGSIQELKRFLTRPKNLYFFALHGGMEGHKKTAPTSKDDTHPLTKEEKKDVYAILKQAKKVGITKIIASPLLKARETARIIQKELHLPDTSLSIDEKVGEEPSKMHSHTQKKVFDVVKDAEKRYTKEKILIVSQKGILSSLNTIIAGKTGRDLELHNPTPSFNRHFFGECIPLDIHLLPQNGSGEIDLHRPYIDDVRLYDDDGNEYTRIVDVFDCWFDSASGPYAARHYPFNSDTFSPIKEKGFPADLIIEGQDQTRGWFYNLLALGVAAFGKTPFKQVVANGTVLAADGKKMSKKLKNYTPPMEAMNTFGTDTIRHYLLSSPAVHAEDLMFSDREANEVLKKFITRLHNCFIFYETYSSQKEIPPTKESPNLLDRWILARLQQTINQQTKGYESYELNKAVRPIEEFVEDLSLWYVRRSRERLKKNDPHALSTLRRVLLKSALCIAPSSPLYAEYLYQRVEHTPKQSVHMCVWPRKGSYDKNLIETMKTTRAVVALLLNARSNAGIKVRQPLQKATIPPSRLSLTEEIISLIREEVNVKEVIGEGSEILLDTTITEDLRREGDAREFIRHIQEARKHYGCDPCEEVSIRVPSSYTSIVNEYRENIQEKARIKEIFIDETIKEITLV